MVSTISAVLIALVSLGLGILIGALLWRSLGPHQHRSRDLEKRLADAERRLGAYQTEVTEHFMETSRRVNDLTRNYKDVHEYLASSAMKLSNPAVGREMQAAARISWAEAGDRNAATDDQSAESDEAAELEVIEPSSERSAGEGQLEESRSAARPAGERNSY